MVISRIGRSPLGAPYRSPLGALGREPRIEGNWTCFSSRQDPNNQGLKSDCTYAAYTNTEPRITAVIGAPSVDEYWPVAWFDTYEIEFRGAWSGTVWNHVPPMTCYTLSSSQRGKQLTQFPNYDDVKPFALYEWTTGDLVTLYLAQVPFSAFPSGFFRTNEPVRLTRLAPVAP